MLNMYYICSMEQSSTEQLIKNTAKNIFFTKGHINAKMHEIATAAKINRALLHYYFRSRENLFEIVLKEAMEESFIKMFHILSEHLPFEEKIEKAVHHIVDILSEYPYIESFIISEINKNPSAANTISVIKDGKNFLRSFLKEIDQYLKKNKITVVRPEQFMVNMMSLCAYPSSTKIIIQQVLSLDEEQYTKFITARKKMLPSLVLMKY
jgi:TetR/AcrR family transcriptional regulator